MNSVERYKKRKAMLKDKNIVSLKPINYDIVNKLTTSKVNTSLGHRTSQIMKEHYHFECDFTVTKEEAKEFLEQFKKDFNQERFDKLIIDCKKEVINSIANPFGLGKIVAAYDKVGGNVDTVHNVRNGTYATVAEEEIYKNRGEYNSNEYHKDPSYIKINAQYSEDRKKGKAKDYITGEQLDQHQSHDLDHIKSAKEIHDDAGRVLAEIKGSELANTEINLKPTTAKNNRSKKADPMEVFLTKKNEKLKKLKELESKDNLSPQEKKELENIKKIAKIDDEKAREADKKARKEIDKKINSDYYGSKKFIGNTAITGVTEGTKMGMQQAIGLVMTEFFTALFDEILDIYKNGFSSGFDNDKFLTILKNRLKTIARKIKARWKDVAIAFKDGFLSGFISNLVTTVINMFVTTAKRVIRIIREGIYSLFKAVKLLIFPPENMTYEEAMHEAKKIIASGLIVTLGVIAEEYIEKFLTATGALAPFASTLTAIFVGAITGLAITMTVYYLDKRKNDKDAIKNLIAQTENSLANSEVLLAKLMS